MPVHASNPYELREFIRVSSHNKQKILYNAFYLTEENKLK